MQDVVELKNGAKKQVQKKMFPGYVLINMVMNDDTWYVVRNTRGVTGFVGPGSKPVPLTEAEMRPLGIKEEGYRWCYPEHEREQTDRDYQCRAFRSRNTGRNKFRRSEENVSVSKGTITKNSKEAISNGKESRRIYQTADSCW